MTLLERVRDHLAHRDPTEKRMFGGVSFMVEDRMLLAVRDGRLLLRIDPAGYDRLLEQGAQQAFMGSNRPMGPGWITVNEALLQGSQLDRWIAYAERWHHRKPTDQ